MTIDAFLAVLRRQWRVMTIFVVVFAVLALGVTLLMPKSYLATTTQFVRGVPGAGVGAEYQAAQFATSRAKSYSVMIANPDVLTGINKDLDMQMRPAQLLDRISADNPVDTNLINVSARGTTPVEAQRISMAAADNLAKLIVKLESSGTKAGKSPIDVQTAVPAPRPTSPASPRPALNLSVGILLGLALGIITALTRDAGRGRRKSAALVDGDEQSRSEKDSHEFGRPLSRAAG